MNFGITRHSSLLASYASLNCCSSVTIVFQRPFVIPFVNMMKKE